ncbi:MAG: hypothetical protein RLZZ306_3621 [Bacteroidota bacterium]
MINTIQYTCECCGKIHDKWPALTYFSPSNYDCLTENDKKSFGKIDGDFCIIEYTEQTDKFIRCILSQKVNDHCVNLEYGLWVSLSDKSFDDYSDNFNNENHITQYFGWLSNNLPEYNFEEGIPTTVITKSGNQRPEIIPHEDFDHPFVRDYYHGIAKSEAEKRISDMLGLMVY